MSAFVLPSGDPELIGQAAGSLGSAATGLDADGRAVHDRIAGLLGGWLGAAGDAASAYLLMVRAALLARPPELTAAGSTLSTYGAALAAAQQTVLGLEARRSEAYADTGRQIAAIEATGEEDVARRTDAALADRDDTVATLTAAYGRCLADLQLAVSRAVIGLQQLAQEARVACAAVQPADLVIPRDPLAAGLLLRSLVGTGSIAGSELRWEQLGWLVQEHWDDPVWLQQFFAAAGAALLAVPAAMGFPTGGPAFTTLSQLGDGLLALQAAAGTAALPPEIQAALNPGDLTLTWSVAPPPGATGLPSADTVVITATVTGGTDFLALLSLVSAGTGAYADPDFVAQLAATGLLVMSDPAVGGLGRPDEGVVVVGFDQQPIQDTLMLAARVPGASAQLVGDPIALQQLLTVDTWEDDGRAVGAVFASLALPVDPGRVDAAALELANSQAQLAVIGELATHGADYTGLQSGARDGLVTMTAYLIPDLVGRTGSVATSRVDGDSILVSDADLHGYLSFLTTDAQDTQDLLVVTAAWTAAGIEAAMGGPAEALGASITLASADGAWLQGAIIDARTDALAESDPTGAAGQAAAEMATATDVWAQVSSVTGVVGAGLALFPATATEGALVAFVGSTIGLLSSGQSTSPAPTPLPGPDPAEVAEAMEADVVTDHQTAVAAAFVATGRLGPPVELPPEQILSYRGVPPPPADIVEQSATGPVLVDPARMDASQRTAYDAWLAALADRGLLPGDAVLVALTQGRGIG